MRTELSAISICMLLILSVLFNTFNVSATENKFTTCSVLIEVESKVIISSKNEYNPVPVGVMSKLMTVYLVAEEIPSSVPNDKP